MKSHTASDAIRDRIAGLLRDHCLAENATDFGGDHLLECAVTELRWCLSLVEKAREEGSEEAPKISEGEMAEYVLLKKRSLFQRILRTPTLFVAHFRAMRVFGAPLVGAFKIAVLLTAQIYRR